MQQAPFSTRWPPANHNCALYRMTHSQPISLKTACGPSKNSGIDIILINGTGFDTEFSVGKWIR